jgi:hypothetical protein
MIVALAVGALIMGCGGDDSSNGSANAANGSNGANSADGSAGSNGSNAADETSDEANVASKPVKTSSLSKAQYLKRAIALCSKARAERRAAARAYVKDVLASSKPGDKSEEELLEEINDKIYVPMKEEQLAELRALGAPAGDEKVIEGILRVYDRRFAVVKKEGATPKPNPLSDKELNAAAAQAIKYGLRACTYD